MKKNIAIKVENIGKKYSLGKKEQYITLRDRLVELPLKIFKKQKKKEFWALKNINFEVKKGEVLGVIGRNGAGKSTLLKILSRITEPTKGQITIKGRVASLLEVGTGFNQELTGRENIYLNGSILGMSKKEIKEKFNDIVKFSGIEKFLDTPVKHYSSGMYIRLAFSVAAHLESEILLVDEVLAVGDVEFQKKCLGKMDSLAKSGRTVIFISHNMAAIKSMCNRTIFIKNGYIKVDSDTDNTISKYLDFGGRDKYKVIWSGKNTPCNNSIKLKKVMLTINKKLVKKITTNDSFKVSIKYQTLSKNVYAGMTISIHDQHGVHIFSSINNQGNQWHSKPMPKGVFTSICTIPKHLLNEGVFILSINIFGRNYTDQVIVKDIIAFEVVDGNKVRGDYMGKFGGLIRPMLKWETGE